jgi:hypothetical protein
MGSPPPQVTIFQSVSDIIGTAEAAADGDFVLESFVAGAFRFRVDIEGFRRWWGGESYESARVAEIQPGEVTTLPDYEESGILLTLEGPGGAPVGPARIDLRDAGQHPVTPSDFIFDSGAPVRIPNLVPGEYLLRVEPAAAGASDQAQAPAKFHGKISVSVSGPYRSGGFH